MGDARLLEQGGEQLGLINGDGTHQHGLAAVVALADLLDNGAVLPRHGLVDGIVVILADHGLVGGNLHHVQAVDLTELVVLGHGGTRHTRELLVHTEVVLEGDGGQGLVLLLDLHPFLGLNGLMETVREAAAGHESACEGVHDHDTLLVDHIVHVQLHTAVGLDGLIDVVGQGGVLGVGEVGDLEEGLGLTGTAGGDDGGVGLLVHDVVGLDAVLLLLGVDLLDHVLLEGTDKAVGSVVEVGGGVALTRDDQRGTGLVDEDGVHLVHDGEGVAALDQTGLIDHHVVAEVVEAELVVGAVGDVGVVGLLLLGGGESVDHQTRLQPHEAVDLAHLLGVAGSQVVVDGDDVDTLTRQGVEVGGESGHQGLTLTRLHLGDTALMEDDTADELDVEGTLAQDALVRLTDGGEGLGEDVVQGLSRGQTLLEDLGHAPKLVVGHVLICGGQCLDLGGDLLQLLDLMLAVGAENFGHDTHVSKVSFLFRRGWRGNGLTAGGRKQFCVYYTIYF